MFILFFSCCCESPTQSTGWKWTQFISKQLPQRYADISSFVLEPPCHIEIKRNSNYSSLDLKILADFIRKLKHVSVIVSVPALLSLLRLMTFEHYLAGKSAKYAGGNSVCPRPTPDWQKGINSFFQSPQKGKENQSPSDSESAGGGSSQGSSSSSSSCPDSG